MGGTTGETPPTLMARAAALPPLLHLDGKGEAPACPARTTYISKAALPFFLAAIAGWQDVVNQRQYACYCNMMSGNTLNLCMAIGNRDWFPTVPFILGTIAHFCAGYFIFKTIDSKVDQQGSTLVIAPVVLMLFVAADLLRPRFPLARWHMWYPAMACGMVNGVSSEKGSAITCMITGHMMNLSACLSNLISKGPSPQIAKVAKQSAGIIGCFAGSVVLQTRLWSVTHPFRWVTRWRYSLAGLAYFIVLVLHELPTRSARRSRSQSSAQ